ncbi:MAG: hypothetical protein JO154_02380 [Chitinophaga sp.]|uniref:hypothetical protein n=1 Tax=Chitinophaga sp. TaxID=1869181 RepID=UPI0025BFE44A|nr:hypothetical protein [Chitinophaga sp.]MBV8251429.1 hypothetical protein [Chitinophaga sp.]
MLSSRSNSIWAVLIAALFSLNGQTVRGQQATIILGESQLSRDRASTTVANINPVTSDPRFVIRSQSPNLNGATGSIPVNQVRVTPIQDNTERGSVTLGQNEQNVRLLSPNPNKSADDPLFVRFDIENLSRYAWKAGRYQTELVAGITSGKGQQHRSLATGLQVEVAPVLSVQHTPSLIRLHINDAQQYLTGYVSPSLEELGIIHTLPLNISAGTDAPYFSFIGTGEATNIKASVGAVKYQLSGNGGVPPIALNTTSQPAYTNNVIPVGNHTDLGQRFTISAEDLKRYFNNPGIYRTTLNLQIADDPASPTVVKQTAVQLEVVVDEVMAFAATDKHVDITFGTIEDYQNGVISDQRGHLLWIGNYRMNLSVRSLDATFNSASSSFPIGNLYVGGISGTSIRTVQMTTTNQILVQGYNPNGQTTVNIRYQIPASKSKDLVGKPKEIYSATILYSISTY